MNTVSKKIVGQAEAFNVFRELGWRMDFLEEKGVKGATFLAEIEEELAQAEMLLSRKFTAKAQPLFEKIARRVEKAKHHAFDSVANTQTIH